MLKTMNELLWGPGTLLLLLGTGTFLQIRLRFLPWRKLTFALRSALGRPARHGGKNGVSPFSALMTALAATLGTGNIVGVSTALVAGGPGALVWMEVSALLGMSTILAESVLAVRYRRKNRRGEWVGGPMYVMEARLGAAGKPLALLFALFAACASLGIGSMTQANAAAGALETILDIPPALTGGILSLLALFIILGGIRSIARVSAILVPAMGALYLAAGLTVIVGHWPAIPAALTQMVREAFSFRAAAGGAAGISAMRWGIARGVFSNEAGLGSSSIAAASAETEHPVQQGFVSMTGPFFDTILMCTVTGLAICCSGTLGTTDAAGQTLDGAALTIAAFETVLGRSGGTFVAVSIVLFAFSTILGWEYTGEKAFEYLSGGRCITGYRAGFALAALAGAIASLETVFRFSDICNALMCLPNCLCLLALSGEATREVRRYAQPKKRKKL